MLEDWDGTTTVDISLTEGAAKGTHRELFPATQRATGKSMVSVRILMGNLCHF